GGMEEEGRCEESQGKKCAAHGIAPRGRGRSWADHTVRGGEGQRARVSPVEVQALACFGPHQAKACTPTEERQECISSTKALTSPRPPRRPSAAPPGSPTGCGRWPWPR